MNRMCLWVGLGSGLSGLATGLLVGAGACVPKVGNPPPRDTPACPCPYSETGTPPPNRLREECLATCPEGMTPLLLPDTGYPDGWKCVCDPNPGC